MAREQPEGLTPVWRPQPGPQTRLLTCPFDEVFFGGARGGGKTDGMLGEWAQHGQIHGPAAIGIFFRRELTQLEEAMARSEEIYGPIGAKWNEQKKSWRFPNGARLKFRYLDRDADAGKYQGHSYTRVYMEELTNWAEPGPVLKLMGTLRSGQGVPCRFRATGNPGGPGHTWVKARYVSPAPGGWTPIASPPDPLTGIVLRRVFIPSRLSDNRALQENDPAYVARLRMVGSESLVRAWLDGDWDVVEGAYFDNWSSVRNVVPPFRIPAHWPRLRGFDWGSASPFAVVWAALSDGSVEGIPRGALVVYREWYGCRPDEPTAGIKMKNEEIARGIVTRERGETLADAVADPAIFSAHGGKSIAEVMFGEGAKFRPADNTRIAGWQQIRGRLEGDEYGRPMLVVFSTCPHLIRTLPALQHDDHDAEDVDTDGEDHAPDALRYLCMTRPYHRPVRAPRAAEVDTRLPTFNELLALDARRSSRRV